MLGSSTLVLPCYPRCGSAEFKFFKVPGDDLRNLATSRLGTGSGTLSRSFSPCDETADRVIISHDMTDTMPDERPMSEAARLSGVFFSPGKAFADIGARPRFWVPLIIMMLLAFGYTFSIGKHIGWDHVVRQQSESDPRMQEMTADQRENAIAIGSKVAGIIGYVSPVFVIAFVAITAGVLLFVFNSMLGAALKFKQVFATVCYAGLVGALSTILSIVMLFVKNPDEFDIQHPLAFNLGAFLGPDTKSKALLAFASSIDLFTLWTIAVMAIGLSAAARKVTFGKALAGVLTPWVVLVLVKVGWAAFRG